MIMRRNNYWRFIIPFQNNSRNRSFNRSRTNSSLEFSVITWRKSILKSSLLGCTILFILSTIQNISIITKSKLRQWTAFRSLLNLGDLYKKWNLRIKSNVAKSARIWINFSSCYPSPAGTRGAWRRSKLSTNCQKCSLKKVN